MFITFDWFLWLSDCLLMHLVVIVVYKTLPMPTNSRIVIERRENYLQFIFYAANQTTILFSRLFRTKALCAEGIGELIKQTEHTHAIEKLQDKPGQHTFVIRDRKGVTLGHSPIFYAASSRDYAIRQLIQEAERAIIEERLDLNHV
jgi:uncharacterized protein YegP (UPF0339 family)